MLWCDFIPLENRRAKLHLITCNEEHVFLKTAPTEFSMFSQLLEKNRSADVKSRKSNIDVNAYQASFKLSQVFFMN